MFNRFKKLRLPFLPKKATAVSLDELITAALEEAKNYPLIQDNDDLDVLFKNKFVTKSGVQIPPREFITKIISYIESNPPQTTEQFAVFIRRTLAAIPEPIDTKKRTRGH